MTATIGTVVGAAHVDVAVPASSCAAATLSSYSSSFSAFSGTVRVNVFTPFSDCRWTAKSNAGWLAVDSANFDGPTFYDPGRSGDGALPFVTAPNNSLSGRTAQLTVTFTDGAMLVHSVSQAAATCSYVVSPTEQSLPSASGGSGSFSVIVTPPTCSWMATPNVGTDWNLQITSGSSGVGNGTVTYTVAPPAHNYAVSLPIKVSGPNPGDPPAVFKVNLPKP